MNKSLADRVLVISCQIKNTVLTDDAYTTVRRLVDTAPELSEYDVIERYLHIGGAQWVRPKDGEFSVLPNGLELMDDDCLPDGMMYDQHKEWVLVAVPRELEYLAFELFDTIWDAFGEEDREIEYCTNEIIELTVYTREDDNMTFHKIDSVV